MHLQPSQTIRQSHHSQFSFKPHSSISWTSSASRLTTKLRLPRPVTGAKFAELSEKGCNIKLVHIYLLIDHWPRWLNHYVLQTCGWQNCCRRPSVHLKLYSQRQTQSKCTGMASIILSQYTGWRWSCKRDESMTELSKTAICETQIITKMISEPTKMTHAK